MRILIAAHYASHLLGGEAAIPLWTYAALRRRGIEAWLVTHDGTAAELTEFFAAEPDRLVLTRSLPGLAPVFTLGQRLPDGPRSVAWAVTQIERQLAMVRTVRVLVPRLGIDVVHQPIGLAPGVPSALTDLGAPLVIGPLNGGLSMPPAFRARDSRLARWTQRARRPIGVAGHRVLRGQLQAAAVLVANDRTRDLLPGPARRRASWMPESAVAGGQWPARAADAAAADGTVRFAFAGRLVPYKSPDLVVAALAQVSQAVDARLDVIGDGPMRAELQDLVRRHDLVDRVRFHGWLDRPSMAAVLRDTDVFVFPSLREPGGTVVLEAMASGLPAIVADWGGPGEYVTDGTGLRVDVSSAGRFAAGLVEAMLALAADVPRRRAMGQAARARVLQVYEWDVLAGRLVEIYTRVAAVS